MLRTHVSFESTPGAVIDSADAAALAPQLITALKQHGVAATPVRALDYAQEFELRYGGRTFYSMLGPANDEDRQWLWFADSTLGAWARLVGRRDESEHTVVLQAMNAVLHELRMQSVRWYTAADWNEAPADHWHPEPGA